MSSTIQILSDILKKSDLTEKEQEAALNYFNQVPAKELNTTIKTFKDDPAAIAKFWRILYLKTTFLNIITQAKTLPEKEKNNLTVTISKMNEIEFITLIDTLSNTKNTADINNEIQKIFITYKKINSEITELINNLIKK
jgi:hypothetical protein